MFKNFYISGDVHSYECLLVYCIKYPSRQHAIFRNQLSNFNKKTQLSMTRYSLYSSCCSSLLTFKAIQGRWFSSHLKERTRFSNSDQ